jgi:hypothetical protein
MDCGGCTGGMACVANVCITCTTHSQCGAGFLCRDGVCQLCTVSCPGGDPVACGEALQEALDAGGMIYVCPGRYEPPATNGTEGFVINDNGVAVIGAGQDDNPTANTILDLGARTPPVDSRLITNRGGTSGNPVTLANLRITGGRFTSFFGGATAVSNREPGVLEMTDCTVIDNGGTNGGSAIENGNGAGPAELTMTRCTITDNDAANGFGGGIRNLGTLELDACTVSGNTALRGAGIATQGGEVTLRNGTSVDLNIAPNFGGGIYNENSDVTIDASFVTGNQTTGPISQGGGINNVGGQFWVINGSRIKGNTSVAEGGGIFNSGTPSRSGPVDIDASSSVTENTAPAGRGGGIFNFDHSAFQPAVVTLATDQIVTNNTGGNCATLVGPPIANCNG